MAESISVLIYGQAKQGKSTLAVSAPGPRLLIDVEAAARFLPITSIKWDPSAAPPDVDGTWDTAVVDFRTWDQWGQIWQWLQSGQHPFQSVIIDSVSEFQQKLIDKHSRREQMSQQTWGTVLREISGVTRDLRDLTEHPTTPVAAVVLTAMARDYNGVMKPYVQGSFATVLPYLLDMTAYLSADERGDRTLLTQPTDFILAGCRAGDRLPRLIAKPNIESILAAVFAEVPAVPAVSVETQPQPQPQPQ